MRFVKAATDGTEAVRKALFAFTDEGAVWTDGKDGAHHD